jgi:hypothetical protein
MPRNEAVPLETAADVEAAPAEPAFRYASDAAFQAPAGAEMDAATGLPAAAWYQDPENAGGMRYWDGRAWTEHRTDYLAAPPKPKPSEGMVIAGYLTAFLLPIVGVVIGVMLLSRDSRHGRWIIALSLLFMAVFLAISAATEPQ